MDSNDEFQDRLQDPDFYPYFILVGRCKPHYET
jgi:hypothetical protein